MFDNDLTETQIKTIPHRANREVHEVDFTETFGCKLAPIMKKGKPVKNKKGEIQYKTKSVKAFKKPGPLTPEIDPNYKFQKMELLMFLMALETGDSIYIQGHSGTGKSAMVAQIAARLNYNLVQINFDGHLLRSDLVGELKIVEGSTQFRYGLVPLGFVLPGTILSFDECDAVAPETAFVLQRAVSSDRKFLMHETNEQFELHPQNAIVATANTSGMGDDSGLYVAGTNVQNFSFQNRWDTVMNLDYLTADEEAEVLQGMFPNLKESLVRAVVTTMEHVREGYKSGTIATPLTTRDSIRWLTKIRHYPRPMKTAEFSFLNRMSPEDAMSVAEIINNCFPLTEREVEEARYLTRAGGRSNF